MFLFFSQLTQNFFFQLLDWKKRNEAIGCLVEFAKKYEATLPKSRQAQRYLDIFMKLVGDRNPKVALSAITSFSEVIGVLKVIIQPSWNKLINIYIITTACN